VSCVVCAKRNTKTSVLEIRPNVQLVPRNFSRGRGVIPTLAELREQSYQLTSAWVLPVWNVVR
jgi:hypothetical protein